MVVAVAGYTGSEASDRGTCDGIPSEFSPTSEDGEEERAPLPEKLSLRESTELFFEHPGTWDHRVSHVRWLSWRPAKVVSVFTILVIILSQIVICLETLPVYYLESRDQRGLWLALEVGVVTWFTGEYVLRLWGSSDRCEFVRGWLNIFDLVAIVPFYIEHSVGGGSNFNFKVFRLFRVIRILKVSRFLQGIQTIMRALDETKNQLLMGLCLFLISLFLWATVLFYVERESNRWDEENHIWVLGVDELTVHSEGNVSVCRSGNFSVSSKTIASPFQSIPHSFWWCVTTLTTVGYGDAVPYSPAGQVCAAMTMVTGVFVLALPTSIIGSKFLDLYKEDDRRKKAKDQLDERARRDADMTELLLLVGDLARDRHLSTASSAMTAECGLEPTPGQAEEILACAFAEAYYPRLRAIYQAAQMAPDADTAQQRFVKNVLEFLRQKRYLEQLQRKPEPLPAAAESAVHRSSSSLVPRKGSQVRGPSTASARPPGSS